MSERRVRTNAKQTAKGEFYFDVTSETTEDDDNISNIQIVDETADDCVEAVKSLEKKFLAEGFKIVKPKEDKK